MTVPHLIVCIPVEGTISAYAACTTAEEQIRLALDLEQRPLLGEFAAAVAISSAALTGGTA
jgi:hypothetical protein